MDYKRNLDVVSEENARLIIKLCNLSGLDWYVKDDNGFYHLIVSIDENTISV